MKKKKPKFAAAVIIVLALVCTGAFVLWKTNQPAANEELIKDGTLAIIPSSALTYDEEAGREYYNGYLYAILQDKADEEEQKRLAGLVDGKVIGSESGAVEILQIRVPETSFDKGRKLAERLVEEDSVIHADWELPLDYQNTTVEDNNPWTAGDTVIDDKNDHLPGGNDWWAESANLYPVWNHLDDKFPATPVPVGVIDSGFELDHPELDGRISMHYQYTATTPSEHGTAVTGLIGASNNNIGIRGSAGDIATISAISIKEMNYSTEFTSALNRLITDGKRVINISQGLYLEDESSWKKAVKDDDDFRNVKTYDEYLETMEQIVEEDARRNYSTLASAISQGYDKVLIVQAAGNGYGNYLAKSGRDSRYSGVFAAKPSQEVMDQLTKGNRELQQKVRDAVMIVASHDERYDVSGQKKLAYYSSFGSNVDIAGPGTRIFTLDLNHRYTDESELDGSAGTSYAAPIVSGTAALLWSVEPDLSAGEVKTLLTENSSRRADDDDGPADLANRYPALDAWGSLSALLEQKGLDNPYEIKKSYQTDSSEMRQAYFNVQTKKLFFQESPSSPDIIIGLEEYDPGKLDYFTKLNTGEFIHLRVEKVTDQILNLFLELSEDESSFEGSRKYELHLLEKDNEPELNLSGTYINTSGAGAWADEITVDQNNHLTGFLHDGDFETLYYSAYSADLTDLTKEGPTKFTVKVSNVKKEAADLRSYEPHYSKLEEQNVLSFKDGDRLSVYLPGYPVSGLSDAEKIWITSAFGQFKSDTLEQAYIFNERTENGYYNYSPSTPAVPQTSETKEPEAAESESDSYREIEEMLASPGYGWGFMGAFDQNSNPSLVKSVRFSTDGTVIMDLLLNGEDLTVDATYKIVSDPVSSENDITFDMVIQNVSRNGQTEDLPFSCRLITGSDLDPSKQVSYSTLDMTWKDNSLFPEITVPSEVVSLK